MDELVIKLSPLMDKIKDYLSMQSPEFIDQLLRVDLITYGLIALVCFIFIVFLIISIICIVKDKENNGTDAGEGVVIYSFIFIPLITAVFIYNIKNVIMINYTPEVYIIKAIKNLSK